MTDHDLEPQLKSRKYESLDDWARASQVELARSKLLVDFLERHEAECERSRQNEMNLLDFALSNFRKSQP
jgi:hypothetical protein